MSFFKIFSYIRIQDLVDVFFLTIVTYHLYLWFRGTKALKALIGLLALGGIFTIAQTWGLFLTTWVFQILWQVLIILLIILFQPEIRQVLEKVNPFKGYDWRTEIDTSGWIDDLITACFEMGKRGLGALVIIERSDRVDELLTGGVKVEGHPSSELLLSIFNKNAPLHDGAILIRDQQVISAAKYLPLTSSENIPKKYGTRHRAALGLTERSDAWVIVVSEERGDVSLARDGYIGSVDEKESLRSIFAESATDTKAPKKGLLDHLRMLLTQRWPVKLGAFALVTIVWLVFAGQQDFEVQFEVPVTINNLPGTYEIIEPPKPAVLLTARGLRKDASTLSQRNVEVELDLSLANKNRNTFRITPYNITLPNDRIDIVKIKPELITFSFSLKQGSRIEIEKESQPAD